MKKLFFNNIFKNTKYEFDCWNIEKVVLRILSEFGIPMANDVYRLTMSEKYLLDYLYRLIYPIAITINTVKDVKILRYRNSDVFEIIIWE